jgi:diguanylate cyclase (GGDEF)-like protein
MNDKQTSAMTQTKLEESSHGEVPKGKILVIDDSDAIRSRIKEILINAQLVEALLEASSGLDGFKLMLENQVDLVICDVVMPVFDGFKFLISKSTRPDFNEIPVIMLTSQEDVNMKIKGLEQGASDYVTKPFDEGELVARVKVQLKIKHLQDALKEKNDMLRELSGTDELTRINNRRRFMEVFRSEFNRAVRYKHSLAFVIFDIDYFKQINDQFGHIAGDLVLVEVARLMSSAMRKCDILGRYGGEEFTLLLPETALKGAVPYAQRLRKGVSGLTFSNIPVVITMSGGVASYPENDVQTVDELLQKADTALYRAKSNGRNRIEIAD